MFIRSLEQMEQIVEQRKFLHWDGWTVVQSFPSEKGRTSRHGLFMKGRWYIQKRFEPNENGWNIPNKIVPSNKRQSES